MPGKYCTFVGDNLSYSGLVHGEFRTPVLTRTPGSRRGASRSVHLGAAGVEAEAGNRDRRGGS